MVLILIPISFATDDNSTQCLENGEFVLNENSLDEIHVDINGNDDNNGDSQNPVSTIKKAINISSENSKIIVHEGIYKENNLNITKSLEIHGQGNVVIDAENKNRIFTINTNKTDTVVLSGITFINGNSKQMAGAIYVLKAQTTIDDCRFINNTATTEGGAIFWNGEYGILSNCLIENNHARDGSGVKWGESDTSISLGDANYGNIINCTFKNNHLMQDEDACIGLTIYSNVMNIINSTFTDHKTDFNSSFEVLYINGDSATVTGCLFANNSMTMTGALGFDGNYAKAYNNRFINNTISFEDSFGGAIGIQSETATIYNNTFIGNGGEKAKGGAIFISSVETFSFIFINVTDNVFIQNNANEGAGIYAHGNSNMLYLLIRNNAFNNDRANTGAAVYLTNIYNPTNIENNNYTNLKAQKAAGIYAYSSIINIKRNLMYNCTTTSGGNIYSNGEINSNLKLKFNNAIGALNQTTILTADLVDDMNNSISSNAISFKVNGTKITGNISENSISTIFDKFGEFIISGTYNQGYATVENGTLQVLNSLFLNADDIVNYGKNVNVNVKVTDVNGNPIQGKEIILNFGKNDILLTSDKNGVAQFTTSMNLGNYTANFRYEDDKYYKSTNKTITITVLNSIKSDDMTRAYNSGIDFKAIFYNGTDFLRNTKVIFNVNGNNYEVFTDSNGVAILNKKLNVGSYSVILTNPANGEVSYNSLKIVERIGNNKDINVYFTETVTYKIRVFDDNGNPCGSNEKIKVVVNKKIHYINTDKNGYAVLKIKLNTGLYAITATYKDVKVSNKIVVKKILTAKNISKKKSKKIKFKAKLAKGKKAISGKNLKFKIKGKTYKVKTNKKGIATLTLKNLKKGKYIVYTSYGSCKIKNTIKIK